MAARKAPADIYQQASALKKKRDEGGKICHVARPGEPDEVHWLGFDCGHAWDIRPAESLLTSPLRGPSSLGESYKTIDYVRYEVTRLAEQCARVARGLPARND